MSDDTKPPAEPNLIQVEAPDLRESGRKVQQILEQMDDMPTAEGIRALLEALPIEHLAAWHMCTVTFLSIVETLKTTLEKALDQRGYSTGKERKRRPR